MQRLQADICHLQQLLRRVAATPRLTRHDRIYRRILNHSLAEKKAHLARSRAAAPARSTAPVDRARRR